MYWNKFWSGLLLAFALFATVLAAPHPLHDASLVRRAYTKEDVYKWEKVVEWLKEKNIDPQKMVFYSDGRTKDSNEFVKANPSYGNWENIYQFKNDFGKDFGDVDPKQDDIAKAISLALAKYAQGEVRVFGAAGSAEKSVWRTIELPVLLERPEVTAIWSMKDKTTDPEDHEEDSLKPTDGDDSDSDDDDDDDDDEDN